MKKQANRKLPLYERVGGYYIVNFNHREEIVKNIDGSEVIVHVYDSTKFGVLATRNERIQNLIATRYTKDEEIATINNRESDKEAYVEYQAWRGRCKLVSAENSDENYVYVPYTITVRQGQQMLQQLGKLGQVQSTIDAIADSSQRELVQIFWDKSNTFERDNPYLNQLASDGLGMTQEELDNYFIEAAKL